MSVKTIKKSIQIEAPSSKVWEIMLNNESYKKWTAVFSPTSSVQTDWNLGSKVVFGDGEGNGLVGRIVEKVINQKISFEYDGFLAKNVEDYQSPQAQIIKGTHETYTFTEKDGLTHLAIECDMFEDHFESMSKQWDQALQKVKEMSEATD